MDETYDIAVIGAGIVGVSTALHLLMRGKKVMLIDRRGAGQETSYGNAGVIGGGYVLPFGFPPWSRFPAILFDRDTAARLPYTNLPRLLPWLFDFYLQSLPDPRRVNGLRLHPFITTAVAEHRALMRGTDAERHLSMGKQAAIYRSESSFAVDSLTRDVARARNVPFEIFEAAAFREIEPHLKQAFHKAIR